MSNLGNGIIGFFGGESSGGGGGTSTGVNGLNGTTNIGLGGTLSGNTLIDASGFNFEMTNGLEISFKGDNGVINSKLSITKDLIQTTFDDSIISAQQGFYLDFSVKQYIFGGTDALINCDSTNQKIIFGTKFLQLDGITLNSGATTISVNTIPITINSTQYYILLAT